MPDQGDRPNGRPPSAVVARLVEETCARQEVRRHRQPFGLPPAGRGNRSAIGRTIFKRPNGYAIAKSIRTEAPINHGNFGGPCYYGSDRDGVNAQIASGGGGSAASVTIHRRGTSVVHHEYRVRKAASVHRHRVATRPTWPERVISSVWPHPGANAG